MAKENKKFYLQQSIELTKIWIGSANKTLDATEVIGFLESMHSTIASLSCDKKTTKSSNDFEIITSIDLSDLGLIPHAKAAAEQLKKQFPSVVFTSGRRSVSDQANAMAGNVVMNRKWIEQTYAASAERTALQAWVDANPDAKDRPSIAKGLKSIMEAWSDAQRIRLSRHFAGLAFDISPTSGSEVKKAIKKLPELKRFLDSEGGITIWHAEFNKA